MTWPFTRRSLRTAFICGCGHSGTTLLATILSTHPEIYTPYYESEAFLYDGREQTIRLRQLRAELAKAGKRYLVEKTPRHIRFLSRIRDAFPSTRFIVMVRDGRDVTASIGERTNGDFAAGFDRWVTDTGIAATERHSPDVFILRYEDLIADPPKALRAACEFLGVPFTAELLNYHAQPRMWYGRTEIHAPEAGTAVVHEDRRNWQVNQPIFDGRGRWKKDLPAEFVAKFETGRAREIMEAFGYGAP